MANMESMCDKFLNLHCSGNNPDSLESLEHAKEALIVLINDCFKDYVATTFKDYLKSGTTSSKASSSKSASASTNKSTLDNPAEATSEEDLKRCTIQTLTRFCKEHNLKVGGKKDEVVARTWRHLQGQDSDEDHATRKSSKGPKPPTGAEQPKNTCCGITKSKGTCILAGTSQHDGKWFCWRHQPIPASSTGQSSSKSSKSNNSGSEPESQPESNSEPDSEPESAPPPAPAAPAKKTPKTKRKVVVPESLEEEQ